MDNQRNFKWRARRPADGVTADSRLGDIRVSWRRVAEFALLCLAAFLTFFNLTLYPSTWFDEGVHLLAAKAIAFDGQYTFGPAVGPTVLFPVAAFMRIFGPSLLAARLAMTPYLLLCLLAFYVLALRLGNWKTAVVGTLVYLLAPGIEFLWYGRQVLGEIPATLFMLAGITMWLKALDGGGRNTKAGRLILAGFCLGLAILSKNQYVLVLPAWVAVWVLDRLYYHRAGHADFVVPILATVGCVVLWYTAEWLLLPNGQELARLNLSEWTNKPGQGFLALSLPTIGQAFKFLLGQDALYGGVVVAWLYAVARSLRRADGLAWPLITALMTIWLGWFAVLSAGYPRYAFGALVFGAICLAHFAYDATGGYRLPLAELVALRERQGNGAPIVRAVLMAFFVVIALRVVNGRLHSVISDTDRSPQLMASYITLHVPSDVTIETYDPEICFLSGHACHFPPSPVYRDSVRYGLYGGSPPYVSYPLPDPGPHYLLISAFARRYGLYDPEAVRQRYVVETSLGGYDLYRLKQG